jgi:hypothetical protein
MWKMKFITVGCFNVKLFMSSVVTVSVLGIQLNCLLLLHSV